MYHVSEDALEEYSLHHLRQDETETVAEHLVICEKCRVRLESIETFIDDLRANLGGTQRSDLAVRNRVVVLPFRLRMPKN